MPWSMRSARSRRRPGSRRRRRVDVDGAATHYRHTPRKRRIQYAATSQFDCKRSGILDHPLSRMMTLLRDRIYRCYCAGAVTATLPAGTLASAVLVDLDGAACGFSALTVSLAKRSCIGLAATSETAALAVSICGSTSATASVVTRLVS